jgi:hypothetical protein
MTTNEVAALLGLFFAAGLALVVVVVAYRIIEDL